MRSKLVLCSSLLVASFGADLRTGLYRGREVTFENVDGVAMYQGDIVLGTTAELEAAAAVRSSRNARPQSTTISSTRSVWPNGVIPYTVDPSLGADQSQYVTQAVSHWNSRTTIRLVQRTSESSYVRFTTGTSTIACSSNVGMVGGVQLISLPAGCGLGNTIHEIGHAVGLWHEQSRNDRNLYVTVLYDNIDKPNARQFDQTLQDGLDAGPYDFNSIMHYGPYDFSRDDLAPTLESVPAGIPFGQRDGLSAADIDAVQRLYGKPPSRTTVASTPSGLKLRVDGVLVDDGTSFDWAPGSSHIVEAPFQGDPRNRYQFGSWSDGGGLTHTFTASSEGTVLIANFVKQVLVSAMVNPASGGSITIDPPSADGFYTDRSNIFIRATPADGYYFVDWSVRPSRSLNPKWHTISGATNVLATFSRQPVTTFTSNPVGQLVVVDGNNYTAPVNFAWAAGEAHQVDVSSTQPDFVHYRFTGWDDGGPQSRNVTSSGQTASYQANFVTQHRFTATLATGSRSGRISVTPSTPDGFYDEGTALQLSAIPSVGYALQKWDGDMRGAATSVSLVMDEQKLVNVYFVSQPALEPLAIVSAATGERDAVAPGEIVSVYGSNIGPSTPSGLQVSAGKVTTELAGVRVLFDGRPAAITYASSGQVNVVAPYGIGGASTSVQVQYNGRTIGPVRIPVQVSAPGIFTYDSTGRGGGAIVNQDGSTNTPANPATRNSIVVLYATGEGSTAPAVADGQVASSVFPKPVLPVSVRIGGVPAPVHYAGAAPYFVAGVMQINVQVPEGIQPGAKVPLTLIVGDQASPSGVTIAVQ